MTEAQQVQMHLGFLSLEQVLPLVRMKRSTWYTKQKLGLVPKGQPLPLVGKQRIYSVEEIQALLRSMEAAREPLAKGKGAAA